MQRDNKIFDLVLNLNNLSNLKSGLDKIKEIAVVREEKEKEVRMVQLDEEF